MRVIDQQRAYEIDRVRIGSGRSNKGHTRTRCQIHEGVRTTSWCAIDPAGYRVA